MQDEESQRVQAEEGAQEDVQMEFLSQKKGKPMKAPKGHLAVYVGESAFETTTYFVPVIYFNHPQFGKQLELAEKVNGFIHQGRISIPCEVSEFEKVKKSIAASKSFRWHRWSNRQRL